ncbi:retrovirus-related pol polyprotein from transposon TNT 1-94, partial [Tanacetum coccineum]
IKREYSNARTPQQNGVAERKNRTLIEAARTMLADSFLPNTFWAEAVSTACYVLNRVLVTKPHNKTPYELLTGKIPIISYIRPFGCHVTILNTIDHLGKFAGKSDEGFLVGYSLQSKAFRVYNLETKRVEENLHITFLENKPNVAGKGPTWLFDLDYLTDSMNYHPVSSENQANLHAGQQEANQNAGTEEIIDAGDSDKEDDSAQDCFVLPIWPSYSSTITPALPTDDKREGPREEEQVFMDDLERLKRQEKEVVNFLAGDSFLGNAKSRPLWLLLLQKQSMLLLQAANPVYHSKTKHIAIRHHFIRDAYEKKLIQVLKIHTDDNVADLLTKAFDVSSGLIEFRESLRRVTNGTEALLILTLFLLWLNKVSTVSAKLVPLSKVCTALETLKKNTVRGTNTMAVLDSCPKHNMVAYLEKSEGNAEFHEIIDFLKRSSILHALTVSPVVSTTFVEQFWTSAKSKTINNVRHITQNGKFVEFLTLTILAINTIL